MADVLGEHPAITEERNSLKHKLEILKHSSKVLMRDPEITSVIDLDDAPAPRHEEEKRGGRHDPSPHSAPGRSPHSSHPSERGTP